MKFKVTQLDLRKDPTFDPNNLIDNVSAHPYIIEIKKHWWNRWKYIMDDETHCPKLFFGYNEVIKFKYGNNFD